MERGGFHGYPNLPIPNSAASPVMPMPGEAKQANNNGGHPAGAAEENECTVREQDRFMPIANVIRIMRKILPGHAKISDDAKETIQECVSEYISFITGEANERCQREQRKTITAEDVLWAMSKLGFDDYIEPLTLFLHRYRDMEGERSSAIRGDSLQVKRGVDYGQPPPLGVPAFAPVYHHPHHAFFAEGAPMASGFFKDMGNNGSVGPSHQAALGNGCDTIGQPNK